MIFKSEEQLKSYVLEKCKIAVSNSEQKIHNTIDSFLNNYYGEFKPEEYMCCNYGGCGLY